MTQATAMLETYPADLGGVDRQALARCIEECFTCSQACTACADACLSEPSVAELVRCVRENLDCADICDTTGRVLSRHTGYDANLTRSVLEACAMACKSCGDECQRHAQMHEHCRVCAEAAAGASRPAGNCSRRSGEGDSIRRVGAAEQERDGSPLTRARPPQVE